ncbi:DASH family cryptochrome [Christiangramia sp. OXR-203]|uniref:DASH family cryptochrome n=1 Tax=Christiangramia sp. OXR-203 TaxID=3100176 RepID=UPI002AC9B54A|nr:DASH family cryptochrome [Christiangramia sp. OXR-203]WPY99242.1 DASH family cryptochrome [Christiangramia sp. OXR-203]
MSTGLIWFRNDLRTQDHEGLSKATDNHDRVIAVYFFDPMHYKELDIGFRKTGKFRAKFLIETIHQLRNNIQKMHIPLFVFQNKPEVKIAELVKKHQIDTIYFQKEWTDEEKEVERNLKESIPDIEFKDHYQQFLFHPDDIPYDSLNDIPKVFTEFRKKCEKKTEVRELLTNSKLEAFEFENDTKIPSLKDLDFTEFETDERSAFPFRGGEDEALKRVEQYFFEQRNLETYKETRNGLTGTDYSSKLSAWLANGSISPRQIYFKVKQYEKEVKSNQSTYWLVFELIWRDFFKYISLKHDNKIFQLEGIRGKSHEWNDDTETFRNWIDGNTKENFVNANMREIAHTGFMSNRGRQNVNSYLAKELKHDWRKGAAYFESLLIDYDVHSNWGNWMYNSGVGNDPRDRKFNIKSQAERYDPDNDYQNLWLK